jgi:hypothetical protein
MEISMKNLIRTIALGLIGALIFAPSYIAALVALAWYKGSAPLIVMTMPEGYAVGAVMASAMGLFLGKKLK